MKLFVARSTINKSPIRVHTNSSSKPLRESPFISPKTETVRENDNLLKGRNGRGEMSLWETHGLDLAAQAPAAAGCRLGHGAPISAPRGDGVGPAGEKVTAGLGEETECRRNGSTNAVH